MKRNLIISIILALAWVAVAHARPLTHADNPHNMSSGSAAGSVRAQTTAAGGTDQICIFCHTPHSAVPQSPLWSRPDPDTMGAFPLYAGALGIKGDAGLTGYDAASPNYPSGASRMCLSCHDGATSIGILLGRDPIVMEPGSETITNPSAIIDLATSHPISFNYNNTVITTLLSALDFKMPAAAVDSPLDSSGQMQCTTCHDPHEDTRTEATFMGLPFWRHNGPTVFVNRYDDVCNNCHITPPSGAPPLHDLP